MSPVYQRADGTVGGRQQMKRENLLRAEEHGRTEGTRERNKRGGEQRTKHGGGREKQRARA